MKVRKIEASPKLGAYDFEGKELKHTITKSFEILIEQLQEQLSKDYVSYDIEFDDFTYCLDASSDPRRRNTLIRLLLMDAVGTLVNNIIHEEEDKEKAWDRVSALQAMHVKKEEIQSPMMAKVYEEIRLKADKAKPIDLESLYVNMERPDWTEEKQIELVKKGEDAELVEK
jgi:hypothetical protein